MTEKCQYCFKTTSTRHLCAKKYCYDHIFEQFIKSILLEYIPSNYLDLFSYCMTVIKQKDLFCESSDPYPIVKENLLRFVNEYEMF